MTSLFKPGSLQWYDEKWDLCQIDPVTMNTELVMYAQQIVKFKSRYQFVEDAIHVPWQMVAAIHCRESNLNFTCVLHNGECIVGKRLKTKLVPQNRGPFPTWEDSAIDALSYKGLDHRDNWTVASILQACELFNGLGYLRKHPDILSPYLWSKTDMYTKGKYTSDGKIDVNCVDQQPGVVAILKALVLIGEFLPK